MSYTAMGRVMGSGLEDSGQTHVLLALAYSLNEVTGKCFPSTKTIAKLARLSPHKVMESIKQLQAAGLISTSQKPGKTRYFTLHLDRLPLDQTPHENMTPHEKGTTKIVTPTPNENVSTAPHESMSTPSQKHDPNREVIRKFNKEYEQGSVSDTHAPADQVPVNPPASSLPSPPQSAQEVAAVMLAYVNSSDAQNACPRIELMAQFCPAAAANFFEYYTQCKWKRGGKTLENWQKTAERWIRGDWQRRAGSFVPVASTIREDTEKAKMEADKAAFLAEMSAENDSMIDAEVMEVTGEQEKLCQHG